MYQVKVGNLVRHRYGGLMLIIAIKDNRTYVYSCANLDWGGVKSFYHIGLERITWSYPRRYMRDHLASGDWRIVA